MESIETLLAQAKSLRESRTDEAERLLRRIIERAPGDRRGYRELARTLTRRADDAGMAALAERALGRWPDWPEMLELRSNASYFGGDLTAAVRDLAALRTVARRQEYDLMLGVMQHATGALEAAEATLLGALALAAAGDVGKQAQAWVALMRVWRDMGRESLANDAVRAARALYKTKPMWVSSSVSRLVNRRDCPAWGRVKRKDGLAEALARMAPDERPRAPESWALPDGHAAFQEAAASVPGRVWIVKAGDLFGGQGIRLTDDPASVSAETDGVVQRYLDRPFLWEGRKGHLRCYILVTSARPVRAWLWRDGLVRFAPAQYRREAGWLERLDMHITNTALHKGHEGLVFDDDPTVEDRGSVWGLAAFLERAVPDPKALWARIERVAGQVVAMLAADGVFAEMAPHGRAFLPKLIGLDLLLDEALEPWLIEIQRVPGQTGPGPVNTINARMFRESFEMTVAETAGDGDLEAREAEAETRAARRYVRL